MKLKKKDGSVVELSSEEGKKLIDSGEAEEVQENSSQGINDETGRPWENRAKEAERKYSDAQSRIDELQKELDETKKNPSESKKSVEEEEWMSVSRKLAREEMRKERAADKLMQAILDELQKSDELIKEYRSEIESELMEYSSNLRTHKVMVKKTCDEVIGRHTREIRKKIQEGKNTPPGPVNTGGKSTPTPGSETITLTEEELKYEEQNDLFSKGYTESEIREQFNKRNKKK